MSFTPAGGGADRAFELVSRSLLQDEGVALRCEAAAPDEWRWYGFRTLFTVSARERLVALRILNGHSHRVANRPNRVEPRAVKRRPSPLALLTELRATAKARLIAGPKT